MKRVEVYWIDAQSEAILEAEIAVTLPTLQRSNMGYLIEETEDAIRFAFGIVRNPDGSIVMYDRPTVIPRCMIQKIEALNE